MTATKRWTALLLTAAVMMTISGCKTTVVEKDVPVTRDVVVPVPDHHDDHHDDHRPPPPPERR